MMKSSIPRALGSLSAAALCATCLLLPAQAAAPISLSEQYSFAGAVHEWYAEESYYAAPVVTDLDGDGKLDVVNAAYSITVMDAATGALKWRVNAGSDRSTPYAENQNPAGQIFTDIAVKDIDGDGAKEIVAGYQNGSISVLDATGHFKQGWPQQPTQSPIRSLVVEDVNHDGKCELIAGVGIPDAISVWMYRSDGTLAPGWPQLNDLQNASKSGGTVHTGYSYGVFANGITVGNLDTDPDLELIVPTDTAYIEAYNPDGSLVPAADVYGGRPWGKVALYENFEQEKLCENEGWGFAIEGGETRAQLYRAELGHAAARYSDVNGDGVSELVVTALMTDRTGHSNTNWVTVADTRYMTVFILNQDRTRFVSGGYDWTSPPVDLGKPLKATDEISIATGLLSEPVCSDLDGDGKQEILFNSYNGKLHCFSLDGKEQGAWPFTLPHSTSSLYEYASTPTCADLNGDGQKEVIFTSWLANNAGSNTGVNGSLYILDAKGALLASQPLHDGYATYEGVVHKSNNGMARPAVQDVDGDGKQEILINSTYYGLCAYEVSATSTSPAPDPKPAVQTVAPNQAAVLLDGTPITLQAYLLHDNNYVMLRDIAVLLQNTKAKFSVDWSAERGISLRRGQSYLPDGTELKGKGSAPKPYTASTILLDINGSAVPLSACTIENNNYFKLRDLGQALNVQVSWDSASGAVIIDSDKAYSAS